jgi:hypothetical protein
MPGLDEGQPVILANEFAEVKLQIVKTRNGSRLRIESRNGQHAIELCPLELESLTWQSAETFSSLLANPFGKED